MAFALGSAKATPAVASAASRIPGVIAGRSKEPKDFTRVLTDESIDDLNCYFLKSGDGMMESLVNIVSQKKIDAMKSGDKDPFSETIWSPPLRVTRSVLHAVGIQKSSTGIKEQNVAGRCYFFICSTAIPPGICAKINAANHEKKTDIKEDHKFFNNQLKKLLDKAIQQAWDNPEFARSWRQFRLDALNEAKAAEYTKKYENQKTAGEITNKEYNELCKPLKAKNYKSVFTQEEQDAIMDQMQAEFKRSLICPMTEDDEAPEPDPEIEDPPTEYAFQFKIKIFKKPKGVKTQLKDVPPSDVDTLFEKLRAEKEAEFAAAGKTFILDAKTEKELTADATKDLCERAGYQYNQVVFLKKEGKKGRIIKSPDFKIPICYSGFIVRVGFSISLFAIKGKDGKIGIKFQALNRIQLLEAVELERVEDGPEESEYGSDWTFESIQAMVHRRRDEIEAEQSAQAESHQTTIPQIVGQKRSIAQIPQSNNPNPQKRAKVEPNPKQNGSSHAKPAIQHQQQPEIVSVDPQPMDEGEEYYYDSDDSNN